MPNHQKLIIKGARVHNLKNVSLEIGQMVTYMLQLDHKNVTICQAL